MLNFSLPELGMILVIALIIFGPGKLPEVGKALGKGIGELRRSMNGEPSKEEAINIQAKVDQPENEKK
ncbi:Sec-independent protein translocase protein TatA [bioreactor metagenome]|uniref:Sec-independent protein translocase protein TatA n=1 Tax=bioreactor metagenome TaxID=1076179 RepID=A0A645EI26_9ZZZZ